MTVIVGQHVPGVGTYMAADSLAVRDGDTRCPPINKLVRVGEVVIGSAGSAKGFDFLRHHAPALIAQTFKGSIDDLSWLLPDMLTDFGYSAVEPEGGGPKLWGLSLLIGCPSGLYEVDDELCVSRIPDNIPWAIGSGSRFALGAAHALVGAGIPVEQLVQRAAGAAVAYDSMCGGQVVTALAG